MTYEQVLDLIGKLSQEVRELRTAQRKTDRQLKETDEQLKETDRHLKENLRELSTQIGGLGNKFGRFAEGLAFPSMEKILRQRFGLETIAL
jgi:hypothetical protein